MSTRDKKIEATWEHFAAEAFGENGICCDGHREIYRSVYFAGALALYDALVNMDPGPAVTKNDRVTMESLQVELDAFLQEDPDKPSPTQGDRRVSH
jgi:hypothetical protein